MSTPLFNQCDFHVHTRYSACARYEMRLPEIVKVCEQVGISYLGITDHIDLATDKGILQYVKEEISALHTDVRVYLGCEVEIVDVGKHALGHDGASARVEYGLDFVAVAANHFHSPEVAQPEDMSLRGIARHFLEMFRYACTLEFVDIIVHPLVVYPRTFDPACLTFLEDSELMEAIRLAKENHIAMEISPRVLMSHQIDFSMRFYRLCKHAGLRFSIGSDAHSLSNVGNGRILEPIVRSLDLTDEDIWLPTSLKV